VGDGPRNTPLNALSSITPLLTATAAATVLLAFDDTGKRQEFLSTTPVVGSDSVQSSKIVFVNDWNGRDAPDEIYVMNADGTNPRRLTVTTSGNNLFPRWSPNGKRIAFNSDRDGQHKIYLMNADGMELTLLTPGGGARATWSPDGKRIAFTSRSAEADTATREIFVIEVDGTRLTQLTHAGARSGHPDWSPDGRMIAFVSNRDGDAEIYVMNADGTAPLRLTFTAAVDNGPDWSPGGRKIAFQSDRDGNREIYVMNADGTEQMRLTSDPRLDAWPSWSPDGRRIAFTRQVEVVPGLMPPNGSDIFVINADGSELTRVTHTAPAAFSAFPNWGPGQESEP